MFKALFISTVKITEITVFFDWGSKALSMSPGHKDQVSIEDITPIPKLHTITTFSWLYSLKESFPEGITLFHSSSSCPHKSPVLSSSHKALTSGTNLFLSLFLQMTKMIFRLLLKILTFSNLAGNYLVLYKGNKSQVLNVADAVKIMEWSKWPWDAIKTLYSLGIKFMSMDSLITLEGAQKLQTVKSAFKILNGKYLVEVPSDKTF